MRHGSPGRLQQAERPITCAAAPRVRIAALAAMLAAIVPAGSHRARAAAPAHVNIATMALSQDFGTRSDWRFTATQGTPVAYPTAPGEAVPGIVRFCLQKDVSAPCDAVLAASPEAASSADAGGWEAHYLEAAKLVQAAGARATPLLLLRTASEHSGDGDQAVFTQLLAYRKDQDRFAVVYAHVTGRNNSQEVRFMMAGPLAGDVVAAEPTQDAPFGFWMTVSRAAPGAPYKPILHYRSATRYGDNNPLPVIDSEMVNIGAHLGFWKPGADLPKPQTPCPKARLIHMELWCG